MRGNEAAGLGMTTEDLTGVSDPVLCQNSAFMK